jgi:hypothetical protein
MQMLIKNGFEVGNLSVDKNDLPYIYLKDMILNKNISMYKHEPLEKELIHLNHIFAAGRAKVDHPMAFSDGSAGSKDIADSVAGVAFNCMEIMTNVQKFPDTANASMAKGVLETLFPAYQVDPISGRNWTEQDGEFSMMNEQIRNRNPLDNYTVGMRK